MDKEIICCLSQLVSFLDERQWKFSAMGILKQGNDTSLNQITHDNHMTIKMTKQQLPVLSCDVTKGL